MNQYYPLKAIIGTMVMAGLAGVAAPDAHASLLAEYTLDNTRASSNVASGVTAADFLTSENNEIEGFHTGQGETSIEDSYEDGFTGLSVSAAEQKAFDEDIYHAFTLTAASASEPLTFEEMYISHRAGGSGGNRGFFLRSSQDAYSSTIYSSGDVNVTQYSDPATDHNIDLSGLAPDDAITFRIYSYNTNGDGTQYFNHVSVEGGIVPEPASGLVLLGTMGALMMRRRRGVA